MTAKITFKGQTLRTRTQRRYVVVTAREHPHQYDYNGSLYTVPPGIWITRRTDNIDTARKLMTYVGDGATRAIFDTVTGEEVK